LQARIRWYWIPIAIIPAAFFMNLTTTVPVVTGVASILLFRWSRYPESRNVNHLLDFLSSVWPLIIFPITHIVLYLTAPYINLGADKRPDMVEFFFNTSSYVQSLWGGAVFVLFGTAKLLKQLLHLTPPAILEGQHISTLLHPTLTILLLGLMCVWVCLRLKTLKYNHKAFKSAPFINSTPLFFTLIYIGVTYAAISVGGLLGLYPFGASRYASYLLIPILIVVGYCFSWFMMNLSGCIGLGVRWRKILLSLASLLIVLGTIAVASNYNKYMHERAELSAALESIRHENADLLLVGKFPEYALKHFIPNIFEENVVISIGWGAVHRHGDDGGVLKELTNLIQVEAGSTHAEKRVLVIASSRKQFENMYPSYSKIIGKYYRLTQEIKAKKIWAGTYVTM